LTVSDGMRIRVAVCRTTVTICVSPHEKVNTVCMYPKDTILQQREGLSAQDAFRKRNIFSCNGAL
jgi:hypothetical protein